MYFGDQNKERKHKVVCVAGNRLIHFGYARNLRVLTLKRSRTLQSQADYVTFV